MKMDLNIEVMDEEAIAKQKLIDEYQEEHIRWTGRALSQLSFYTYLLLTLSIGFLSFAYDMDKIQNLSFSWSNANWSLTCYIASLVIIVVSIILGLLVNLGRLYDFRLTRKIYQTRQRALKYADKTFDEITILKTPNWSRGCVLIFKCLRGKYPDITLEECKNLKDEDFYNAEFKEKLNILLTLSHDLGLSTWSNIKVQTVFFGIAIMLYVIASLLK